MNIIYLGTKIEVISRIRRWMEGSSRGRRVEVIIYMFMSFASLVLDLSASIAEIVSGSTPRTST